PGVLNRLVANWYQVLCELQPDMIITDHAPTALMVSRDMGIPRINFGDGFTCPAPEYPLSQLHESLSTDAIKSDERYVVEYCNKALAIQGISPISQLADIYQVNETFLMTLAELDHLGKRPQVFYGGIPESERNGL
ncbi:hypothetical protein, partial [Sinorhizobium meliloti]|uniref:hypothetical protein n=1 Tax=Rhizobium meliloti TaxID=382 RepID=UPI0018E1DCEA